MPWETKVDSFLRLLPRAWLARPWLSEGKDEKRPASPASPQKAGQGGTGRSGPGCSTKGKNGFIRAGASPGSLGKMDSGSLRGWILNPPYTVTLTEEASRGSAALPVGGAAHLQLVWQDLKN